MKKIFIINGGQKFGHSGGRFNQTIAKETFEFFEKRGLPLIIEPGKRAFPKTEKAYDVLKVLEKYLINGGVVVKTNSTKSEDSISFYSDNYKMTLEAQITDETSGNYKNLLVALSKL